MSLAEVRIWDQLVGAVVTETGQTGFQYDPSFIRKGIELSPINLPLNSRIYRSNDSNLFDGLPGLLADSLPDRFGTALIDAWLSSQGRTRESFDTVERLCYIGKRGMGALEFKPSKGPVGTKKHAIQIDQMVGLASDILGERSNFETSLADSPKQAVKDLLSIGTAAGGARAKAVIAWNRDTGQIRSGQVDAGPGFEHWLIKFDGVSDVRHGVLKVSQGYGLREYAYYKMARHAGIEISLSEIYEENGRSHFITKRFDRAGSKKIHMQTLASLANLDFNVPGHAYEQAFLVGRQLGLEVRDLEQLFRRMIFNISARNQDDHAKNISFLMDRDEKWRLSPAYDLTFAYNSQGTHTSTHQMSVNGKLNDFSMRDFEECAATSSLRRTLAAEVVDEVVGAVSLWPQIARDLGIPEESIAGIKKAQRLKFA